MSVVGETAKSSKEHIFIKMKSIDIVFPKNNEEEFIKRAKALGTKELIFVYSPRDYKEYKTEEKGINSKTAVVVAPKDARDAKKKYPFIIVRSDRETERWVVEHSQPMLIYGFEMQERKDFMHHRNAGLTDILAKMMHEYNVAYGFSVAELICAPKELQPILLGRLRQNVMIAKKYKIEIILASFAADPMLMRNLKDVGGLVEW